MATVSATPRASVAAPSTLRREYSRLDDDGARTSITTVPASDAGRKLEPPKRICKAIAAAKLATAITNIQRRWCKAQAITRP